VSTYLVYPLEATNSSYILPPRLLQTTIPDGESEVPCKIVLRKYSDGSFRYELHGQCGKLKKIQVVERLLRKIGTFTLTSERVEDSTMNFLVLTWPCELSSRIFAILWVD